MGQVLVSNVNDFFDKVFEEHLSERKIIINEDIDDAIIEMAVLQIYKWNKDDKNLPKESRKKIYIYINSAGGNVTSGFALISAIQNSKTPVVGVVCGIAYSMAGLILIAMDERYAYPLSSILLHDGNTGAYTSTSKFKDITKFYDNMELKIKELVLSRTKMGEELYEQKYGSEFYMFADKAKELGIIDKIIGVDIEQDDFV
jgi:ATP-dependent Clp protease protease subunit